MALTESNPKVFLTATGWLDCDYKGGASGSGQVTPKTY